MLCGIRINKANVSIAIRRVPNREDIQRRKVGPASSCASRQLDRCVAGEPVCMLALMSEAQVMSDQGFDCSTSASWRSSHSRTSLAVAFLIATLPPCFVDGLPVSWYLWKNGAWDGWGGVGWSRAGREREKKKSAREINIDTVVVYMLK